MAKFFIMVYCLKKFLRELWWRFTDIEWYQILFGLVISIEDMLSNFESTLRPTHFRPRTMISSYLVDRNIRKYERKIEAEYKMSLGELLAKTDLDLLLMEIVGEEDRRRYWLKL